MPLHYFRITSCDGGTVEQPAELPDPASGWAETTKVFVDLARGCGHALKENGEWRIELLGSGKEPLYRIRLIAETCEAIASSTCFAADAGKPS